VSRGLDPRANCAPPSSPPRIIRQRSFGDRLGVAGRSFLHDGNQRPHECSLINISPRYPPRRSHALRNASCVFCGAHYLISKQFSSTARSFSHRGNSSRNSRRKPTVPFFSTPQSPDPIAFRNLPIMRDDDQSLSKSLLSDQIDSDVNHLSRVPTPMRNLCLNHRRSRPLTSGLHMSPSPVQCASGMVIGSTADASSLLIDHDRSNGVHAGRGPGSLRNNITCERNRARIAKRAGIDGKDGKKRRGGSGESGKLNHRLHLRGCQRGRWLPLEINLE